MKCASADVVQNPDNKFSAATIALNRTTLNMLLGHRQDPCAMLKPMCTAMTVTLTQTRKGIYNLSNKYQTFEATTLKEVLKNVWGVEWDNPMNKDQGICA